MELILLFQIITVNKAASTKYCHSLALVTKIKSLPNDKILDASKLIAFADVKTNLS